MKFVYRGPKSKGVPFVPDIEIEETLLVNMAIVAMDELINAKANVASAKIELLNAKTVAQSDAEGSPNDRVFKARVDAAKLRQEVAVITATKQEDEARIRIRMIELALGVVFAGEEGDDS